MSSRTIALCLLISSYAAGVIAQNTTFSIRVLNGKTGKPIGHQRLLLFGGATPDEVRSHKLHIDLTTNAEGLVNVTANSNTFRLFEVWPDFMTRCAPQLETFPTQTIIRAGVASPNGCSRSITAQPRPGELTFYVRQPTVREKMNW